MAVSSDSASFSVSIPSGSTLAILSQSVGLRNYGPHYEDITDGLAAGKVTLDGRDITSPPGGWISQIGLQGEFYRLWTPEGSKKVSWNTNPQQGLYTPLVWWKATFPTPPGKGPLSLTMNGAGKGFIYINGNGVGRFWNITAGGSCPPCSQIEEHCDYRGAYNPGRCRCDCGEASQSVYKIPRGWLSTGDNVLVMVEELGMRDVQQIQLQVVTE